MIPIVATWALQFGGRPALVKAIDDVVRPRSDQSYLSAVANGLGDQRPL